MAAVRRRALDHGGDEVRLAPTADAVDRIGRDVRGIERAERRLQREAAAELELVVLAGRGVAGGAAAGKEHRPAVGLVRRVRPERARRHDHRHGDQPEHADAQHYGDHRQDQKLAQHRGLPPGTTLLKSRAAACDSKRLSEFSNKIIRKSKAIGSAQERPYVRKKPGRRSAGHAALELSTGLQRNPAQGAIRCACGRSDGSRRNSCAPRPSPP